MHADWFDIALISLIDRNTELHVAQAGNVTMVQAKKIYTFLWSEYKQVGFFASSQNFLKEIENMFSMFPLNCRCSPCFH